MKQLTATGRVVRGWLGIQGQNVTERLAEAFGLHGTEGILVTGVLEGGPASEAGIRPGDVITHINDANPKNSQELMATIANHPPGTRLEVGGWRGSDRFTIEVVSGQRPASK